MIVFILEKAFLGEVPFEAEFLLQLIKDFPVDWYRVNSDDEALLLTEHLFNGFRGRSLIVPLVLAYIFDLVSLIWVRAKDALHQICSFFRHEFWNLKIAFQYFLVESGCIRILKGQITADQSVEDDSARPNINIWALVALACNHFRSCIARTSAGCEQRLSWFVSVRQSEIHDFYVFVLVQ